MTLKEGVIKVTLQEPTLLTLSKVKDARKHPKTDCSNVMMPYFVSFKVAEQVVIITSFDKLGRPKWML